MVVVIKGHGVSSDIMAKLISTLLRSLVQSLALMLIICSLAGHPSLSVHANAGASATGAASTQGGIALIRRMVDRGFPVRFMNELNSAHSLPVADAEAATSAVPDSAANGLSASHAGAEWVAAAKEWVAWLGLREPESDLPYAASLQGMLNDAMASNSTAGAALVMLGQWRLFMDSDRLPVRAVRGLAPMTVTVPASAQHTGSSPASSSSDAPVGGVEWSQLMMNETVSFRTIDDAIRAISVGVRMLHHELEQEMKAQADLMVIEQLQAMSDGFNADGGGSGEAGIVDGAGIAEVQNAMMSNYVKLALQQWISDSMEESSPQLFSDASLWPNKHSTDLLPMLSLVGSTYYHMDVRNLIGALLVEHQHIDMGRLGLDEDALATLLQDIFLEHGQLPAPKSIVGVRPRAHRSLAHVQEERQADADGYYPGIDRGASLPPVDIFITDTGYVFFGSVDGELFAYDGEAEQAPEPGTGASGFQHGGGASPPLGSQPRPGTNAGGEFDEISLTNLDGSPVSTVQEAEAAFERYFNGEGGGALGFDPSAEPAAAHASEKAPDTAPASRSARSTTDPRMYRFQTQHMRPGVPPVALPAGYIGGPFYHDQSVYMRVEDLRHGGGTGDGGGNSGGSSSGGDAQHQVLPLLSKIYEDGLSALALLHLARVVVKPVSGDASSGTNATEVGPATPSLLSSIAHLQDIITGWTGSTRREQIGNATASAFGACTLRLLQSATDPQVQRLDLSGCPLLDANGSTPIFPSDDAALSVLESMADRQVQVAQAVLGYRILKGMYAGPQFPVTNEHPNPNCDSAMQYVLPLAQDAASDSNAVSRAPDDVAALWEVHEDSMVSGFGKTEELNVDYIRGQADAGDINAAGQMGELLVHGHPAAGLRQDVDRAFEYLRRAGDGGDLRARTMLAVLMLDGLDEADPRRNLTLAMELLEQSAAGGDLDALSALGFVHQTGVVPEHPVNLTKAVYYLSKAADAGLVNAHSNLAALYLTPDNNPSFDPETFNTGAGDSQHAALFNATKARYHLEQAALSGFAPAVYNLGLLEMYGWDTNGVGNCTAAAPHLLSVALNGRWVDEVPFSKVAAHASYDKVGAVAALGIRSLLGGGSNLGQVTSSGYPVAAAESRDHLERALLHYLVLSVLGNAAAQDNAGFVLESGTGSGMLDLMGVLRDATVVEPRESQHLLKASKDTDAILMHLALTRHAATRSPTPALLSFAESFEASQAVPSSQQAEHHHASEVEADGVHIASVTLDSRLAAYRHYAEAGNAHAWYRMGLCMAEGWRGVPQCSCGTGAANGTAAAAPSAAEASAGRAAPSAAAEATIGIDGQADVPISAPEVDAAATAEEATPSSPQQLTNAEGLAHEWLQRATNQSYAHATFVLAIASATGRLGRYAIPRNLSRAWELLDLCVALDQLAGYPVASGKAWIAGQWAWDQASMLLGISSPSDGSHGNDDNDSGGGSSVSSFLWGLWDCLLVDPYEADEYQAAMQPGAAAGAQDDYAGWVRFLDDLLGFDFLGSGLDSDAAVPPPAATETSNATNATDAATNAAEAAAASSASKSPSGRINPFIADYNGDGFIDQFDLLEAEAAQRYANDIAFGARHMLGPFPISGADRRMCSVVLRATASVAFVCFVAGVLFLTCFIKAGLGHVGDRLVHPAVHGGDHNHHNDNGHHAHPGPHGEVPAPVQQQEQQPLQADRGVAGGDPATAFGRNGAGESHSGEGTSNTGAAGHVLQQAPAEAVANQVGAEGNGDDDDDEHNPTLRRA